MAILFADNRENSVPSLLENLITKPNRLKIAYLEYGDYSWMGYGPENSQEHIAIERKRSMDFTMSVIRGRMTAQVVGLLENYDRAFILLEGTLKLTPVQVFRRGASTGLNYALYAGYMMWLAEVGIHIIMTDGIQETSGVITAMFHRSQKRYEMHTSYLDKPKRGVHQNTDGYRSYRQMSLKERVIAAVPGMRMDTALKLARKFPHDTIANMVMSNEARWRMAGASPDMAKKLFRLFHGKVPS